MKTSVTSTYALALGFLLLAGCSSDDSSTSGNDSGVVGDDSGGTGPDATTGDDAAVTPDANTGTPDSSGDDTSEAGTIDAGRDAGHDAGTIDAGHDAGTIDAGHDSGTTDAATDGAATDASATDGAATDASVDATTDAGSEDGGTADSGDAAATGPTIIGAWNFNEGTGTSSADLSGNGHPAVFSATGASWGTGKEGKGLALDGTAGYADVGVTLVDTTGSFSVVGWANLNVVNNWEIVASEDDVNGSLFGLKLRGDNNQFDFDVETSDVMNPGFVVAQATTAGTASVWVHLAGVHDASGTGTLKVYVNGALEQSVPVKQALLGATGHFLIGRGRYNGGVGSYLNGTIDEVAVYGGALTDAQVAALYTAQK